MGLGYIVNDPALFEIFLVPEPEADLGRLVLVALGLARRGRGTGPRVTPSLQAS